MYTNTRHPSISSPAADCGLAFAETLTDHQRARLFRLYSPAAAVKWSNFPQGYLGRNKRVGLSTSTLTPRQWGALMALLAATTGAGAWRGVDAIRRHLDSDDYLRSHGGGEYYGRGNFTVALLGEPSDSGWWHLQFGGHHLALVTSYFRGEPIGLTLSFWGVEPFSGLTDAGGARGHMAGKRRALANLLSSLDESQLDSARLRHARHDLLLGAGQDSMFPTAPEGIAGNHLDAFQLDLLIEAIGEWVRDADDASARRTLIDYALELDRTHLAFSGTTALESPGDYVVIDGPRVWIEFSMQDGVVLADPHPHTVWRDRRTDYGGRLSGSARVSRHAAPLSVTVTQHRDS